MNRDETTGIDKYSDNSNTLKHEKKSTIVEFAITGKNSFNHLRTNALDKIILPDIKSIKLNKSKNNNSSQEETENEPLPPIITKKLKPSKNIKIEEKYNKKSLINSIGYQTMKYNDSVKKLNSFSNKNLKLHKK